MKELLSSFFKTSEERIKNPLIGTFILAFIAYNWKAILILIFSNKSIEEKITLITTSYSSIGNILIYPILISIFYILILPYIMWFFDFITFKAIKGRNVNLYKNKLFDIEGKKNIASEEIELENLKADYKEKSDLNKKVKNLEHVIETKNLKLEELSDILSDTNKTVESLLVENKKKDSTIRDLNEDIKNMSILKTNYISSFNKTPKEIIQNFINIIPYLNDYFNNILSTDEKREVENYLSLDLIELVQSENRERFKLTDKGLYFIQKSV